MLRFCVVALLCLGCCCPGFGQGAPVSNPDGVAAPSESLGDTARRMRAKKPVEEKMTEDDTQKLFSAVDEITRFASEDSGFPRHGAVKRQMISQSDAEKFFRQRLAKSEYAERFARSEISMKKFGLLPAEFHLKEFLVKSSKESVAGFYDDDSKTISLLNWIPADKQKVILAHELTHALQDQNFDLRKWVKAGMKAAVGKDVDPIAEGEETVSARRAVVEGQAMVVFMDYLLAPMGRTLKDTPGIVASLDDPQVVAIIDTEVTHEAPMVLREAGSFPYREGLIFEAELLQRGGQKMAFAGAFANPPRSTHEVMEPRAYLDGERLLPLHLPELQAAIRSQYEVYDGGGFGALDVRALLKQYGEKRAGTELAAAWRGGVYVTCKRAGLTAEPAVGDVALLFVSRWKTAQAAERFAHFYAAAAGQHHSQINMKPAPACTAAHCPSTTVAIETEAGPMFIEQWADNTVVISDGFDADTAARFNDVVNDMTKQEADPKQAGNLTGDELSLRLYALPAFRDYQQMQGSRWARMLAEAVSGSRFQAH
jgi:hypothetical protein